LENYTHWPTGSAVTFNGWGTGEPAQLKTEHCGAFQYEFYFQDLDFIKHKNIEEVENGSILPVVLTTRMSVKHPLQPTFAKV
jgi:hypothetical protein